MGTAKKKVAKTAAAKRVKAVTTRPAKDVATRPAKDALLQAAHALDARVVKQLYFDLLAAKKIAHDGLARLGKHKAALARDYRGFPLDELTALPELCDRALAQQRIVQTAKKTAALPTVLPPALAWRRKLLRLAQSMAEDGAVDPKAVTTIEGGSGTTDNLQDVIDLVKLLQPLAATVEAVHGAGALDQAQAAAETALAALGGGGRRRADEADEAADLRDRYATLILLRHDRLRAALAAVTSYAEAGLAVPGLGTGKPGRAAKAASPPMPSPTA